MLLSKLYVGAAFPSIWMCEGSLWDLPGPAEGVHGCTGPGGGVVEDPLMPSSAGVAWGLGDIWRGGVRWEIAFSTKI